MKFTLNNESNRLIFFLYELDNSPIESTIQYEDSCIKLFTYTVKDTDRNNVMGYRVDFLNDNYTVSGIDRKMVNLCFGDFYDNVGKKDLKVVFDDVNFRVITYGSSDIYSLIIKKLST